MAREVQILTWCDNCLATDGSQVEATEQVGLNSNGIRVLIDLCEPCVEALLLPAMLTFDAYGRNEPKPKRKSPKASAAKAEVPKTETSGDHLCEVEGCGRSFEKAQALGMHRFRAHGIESPHRNKGKAA
jgi:hypothetical protein